MTSDLWRRELVHGEVGLAVWRSGEGDDPVVCLHGISAQHRSFNALARRLAGRRPLIGVDLRGRGDSEKPGPGSYGLEAHARDVVRVLDHFGLERATLAGHSMGAFVAQRVALSHPELVRALVLLDGGWPRVEGREELSGGVSEGLARSFSRLRMTFESPDDYLRFWYPEEGVTMRDLPPELADYYRYDLEEVEGGYRPKASLVACTEDAEDVARSALTTAEMSRISCPVALVRAAEGFFPGSAPLISEEVRRQMEDSFDVRGSIFLEDTNHYTLMWEPAVGRWAGVLLEGWTH